MATEGYAVVTRYHPAMRDDPTETPEWFYRSEDSSGYSNLDRLLWRDQWDGTNQRWIKDVSDQYLSLKALDLSNLRWLKTVAGGLLNRSPLFLPSLTDFRVSGCPKLNTFKIGAPLLKRLEVFDNEALASIQVRIQFSAQIIVRTPLPKFDIERIPLEDSDLELVEDPFVKSVDFFDLSYCERITDTGLQYLSKFRPKKLSLRGCPILTTQGVEDLINAILGDLSSIDLGELPQLRLLNIGRGWETSVAKARETVMTLILDRKLMSDRYMRYPIFGLRRVVHLDLSDHSLLKDNEFVGDKSWAEGEWLWENPQWISLSVTNCTRLSDRFFKLLYNCTSLRVLRANHLPLLTDESLKGLGQLEKLSIAKCKQVTDAGLKSLEEIKTLRMLNVKGCPLVTLQGVRSLRKAIPGIQILHDLDSTASKKE